MAPFPLPAHQTGHADLPHPAFRLASWQSCRRRLGAPAHQTLHAEFAEDFVLGKRARAASVGLGSFSRLRLRLAIEFSLKVPDSIRRCQAHRQSPSPCLGRKHTRSQGPSLRRNYPASTVVRPCPTPTRNRRPYGAVEAATLVSNRVSPDYPPYPSHLPCQLPRRIEQAHMSMPSLSTRPSPLRCRVGIHIAPFEACSGFTHITAHRIAQPPKATFVTRLRPRQLPGDAARQLPDSSTSIWMEPSSIGKTRPRGTQRSVAIQRSRGLPIEFAALATSANALGAQKSRRHDVWIATLRSL